MNALEEGTEAQLDFKKLASIAAKGLDVVPVVLQHARTGEVLFIGYANESALHETLRRSQAVLWSTSRNELWHKGATSGDVLDLVEVRLNCEQNSLLYRVLPRRGGGDHPAFGVDGPTGRSARNRRRAEAVTRRRTRKGGG